MSLKLRGHLACGLLLFTALLATRCVAQISYDPTNFTFEAEDFNFNGGQYIDNPTLCEDVYYTFPPPSTTCYFNQVGATNIDQLELNFAVSLELPTATEIYRFGDPSDFARDEWVDTYYTQDTLIRDQYTLAGISDYDVRSIASGEWLNYTRTFPVGNCRIYMRAASGSALAADLHLVADATTTNQSLTYLGRFATGGATTGYEFVPLTDFSGTNDVVVGFTGGVPQTLRVTARANGFTNNFYMLVASTNEANLPPLVQITTPSVGATLEEGAIVSVQATASDAESSVTSVQFYAGTQEPLTLIGETNAGPSYSMDWTPPSLGSIRTYTIRVVAADSTGLLGSDEISVVVRDPAIQVVSTADGNGADAELRESSNTGVTSGGNYGSIRARTTSGNNEIIALRFDLTGETLAALTDVRVNLVCMRDDTSNRQLALYGVAAGTAGASGSFTTEDWDENALLEFGDMPGLLATDGDYLTQSLNTNAVTQLALLGGAVTKGEVKTFSSSQLTDFVRRIDGSSQVTFLIAFAPGYTSTGQARYASKEAESLDGGTPLGAVGDFAPFLQFKTLTNAPPFVTITSPVEGAELAAGVETAIEVDASDADGTVTNVAVYAGTSEPLVFLGEDSTFPYSVPWTPVASQLSTPYTIQAVATDNGGGTAEKSIQVTVLGTGVQTVSTAVGDGADVEMVEQNSTAARNSSDLHTRFNANNRNEVVGLKFDLTGFDKTELNNVTLNMISHRTDSSTRVVDIYGVTQGVSGGSGSFTTENWSDTTVSAWGDMPGLLTSDGLIDTMSIDTANLALLVDDLTMTGLTEGETRTASSPAMTAFIQNYSGSDLVTLLLVAGNTSGGQFTFSSKEAVATSTGVLTGSAGDLAPYLSFTVGQMTPPDLKFSVSGDGATIDFSWTGSYRLQSQTNGLNTGLSTNWVDYPGGTSSPVSVPVDEVQGAVFFRLAQ